MGGVDTHLRSCVSPLKLCPYPRSGAPYGEPDEKVDTDGEGVKLDAFGRMLDVRLTSLGGCGDGWCEGSGDGSC